MSNSLSKDDYVVVWNGRGPLLPDRDEQWDTRFSTLPSYDIDDLEGGEARPKRAYTNTGKYKGRFSRTNPAAGQYVPTNTVIQEGVQDNG